jgi:hypothetical protein
MNKEQIEIACARAGFPAPEFHPKKRVAIITVPIGRRMRRAPEARLIPQGPVPEVTAKQFDKWCGELSHAGVARFVNHHLGTAYTINDVFKMRRRDDKTISARIRALVGEYDQPFDPRP